MKKVFILVLFTITNAAYADTFESTTTTQSQQTQTQPQQKTTIIKQEKTTVTKQENKPKSNGQSTSVYDNIRSGWNKFIDVLAPPDKK